MDKKIEQIIQELVIKFPRRLPKDYKTDLSQALWTAYLEWDGEGEIGCRLHYVAEHFTKSVCRDMKRRSLDYPGEADRIGDANPVPPRSAESLDLSFALEQLPKHLQEVTRLFMSGCSNEEIAEELGRSERWVYYKKDEAFAKIKKLLGENYLAS